MPQKYFPALAEGILEAGRLRRFLPMRHHIERQAAAFRLLVVPARPLALLLGAVEDPGAGIDLHRQDAAEEARLAEFQELGVARQEELVLDDAMLEAGTIGQPRQLHR